MREDLSVEPETPLGRVEGRRPSTECNIPPLLVAGIIAGGIALAGAGVGAGGAAAANKKTGNKARINELEQAQAQGRLTHEGELIATMGQEQARLANEEALRNAEAQQSALGVTSGADQAAMMDARLKSERNAAAEASKAFATQFQQEGQEKEDRKALRRDRTMEIVNFFTKGADTAASAFGAKAGASEVGKTPPVQTTGDSDADSMLWLKENDPEAYEQLIAAHPDMAV